MTCVRVTDGTDTAASVAVTATGTAITFTAKYTGTFGNGIAVLIGAGSAAGTYSATVTAPGYPGERFDNLSGTGNTFWVNLAAAINQGQGSLRLPSSLLVASAGAGTGAPTTGTTYTLTGGTDGASTITAATLVGSDTAGARTGMYALRGQGCAVGVLADADDSTQWGAQAAFGLSEGVDMIATTPSGDTISTAATAKATAAIDSYGLKLMVGDWCLIQDQTNNVQRYVAPSGIVAGFMSAQAPQNSPLNKPLNGIIGTQKSQSGLAYTYADIQAAVQAGLDLIANPSPGGNYFACQVGHNTSSNLAIWGDNYTRMTNYVASSITTFMGQYVGKLNTPQLRANLKASGDTFFQNMKDQGQIDDFQCICDGTNNSPSRISQGYLQIDITVRYLSIVEKLIANIQGGQTVSITRVSTQAA